LDPGLFRDADGEFETGGRAIRRFRMNDRYDRSMIARLYIHDGRELGHYRMVFESAHRSWIVSLSRPVTGREEYRRWSFPIDDEADRERFRGSESPDSQLATALGYAYDGVVTASVKIFERVEGASLVGSAPGASEIEARLRLHSRSANRDFEYRTSTRLTRDGRFELVVPYPTGESKPAVEISALGSYSIRVVSAPGSDRAEIGGVDVSPDQIRTGARIDLGSVGKTSPPSRMP
jgi:dolichyl-diphosphooligosaccharide--protein glycosyltransferase